MVKNNAFLMTESYFDNVTFQPSKIELTEFYPFFLLIKFNFNLSTFLS